MGQAGNVILFMTTLVGLAIAGAYVLAQTARCFLVILEGTAENLDEVTWPRDPWTEWVGRAAHLAFVVALWLVPVGFALRALGRTYPDAAAVLWVALPTLLFWLLFPFNLLSAFSALSPWLIFRWEVVRRIARRPGATVAFYLLSLPVVLTGAAAVAVAVRTGMGWTLALLATLVFLYARLLGRLASILARVRLKTRRPPAEEDDAPSPPTAAERDTTRPPRKRRHDTDDEEALPEPLPPGPAHPDMVEGYGLKEEAPPAAPAPEPVRPRPPRRPKGSSHGPRMKRAYEVARDPDAEPPHPAPDEPEPPEAAREPGGGERPLRAHPWLHGVWSFPWYPSNLGTWGLLTILFLGWGLLFGLALSLLTF